ncbi:MAG: TonB-dependent receptor [Bacteroidia bacterium]|nr:TonB-dependent receptor [Bacteroidia bacterium]
MKQLLIPVFFVICLYAELFAQQDTVQLNTAVVFAEQKWLFASGCFTETTDSIVKKLFCNQLISEWPLPSSLILKNYGPGGIVTASMRGMEAKHTSIIWNGIPVNSPSLGLTDLAILPVSPGSEVTIFHGNASSLYHTAASGSAIIMEEKNRFEKILSVNGSFESGSFQSRKTAVSLQASGLTFYQSFSVKLHDSENDFPFINTALPESPEQKQLHAAENHFIMSGQTGWRITANDELTFSWQHQNSEREIPPMMTQTRSNAVLKDSLLNASLQFKKIISSDFSIRLKTALLTNNQQYHDTVARIFSESKTFTQYFESGATYSLSRSLIAQGGLVYSNSQFKFTDYEHRKQLEDYSAFTSLRFEKKKFNTSVHVRKTRRANFSSPLLASAGLEYRLHKKMLIRATAGSSYQFPTGNDLYWKPGGNSELKPEHCRSIETGADFFFHKTSSFSFTIYRNDVSNWIQWVPGAAGYYTPRNIKKVRAEGIETALAIPITIRQWKMKLSASYTFSKSVNRTVYQVLSDDILNRQLIYIPEHSANSSIHVTYYGFGLWLHYHYNGLRYTTADHSYFLPAYHLLHCALMYEHSFKKSKLQPYLRISNLADLHYQSMAWRPMPGRSFTFGVSIIFQHKPSNN